MHLICLFVVLFLTNILHVGYSADGWVPPDIPRTNVMLCVRWKDSVIEMNRCRVDSESVCVPA